MDRSERLIKAGDSWFSSKAIEVAPRDSLLGVEHCFGLGETQVSTKPMQTPNTRKCYHGRHTAGANFRREEGNNPDRQLRSQNYR